jgi:hypothetical protein
MKIAKLVISGRTKIDKCSHCLCYEEDKIQKDSGCGFCHRHPPVISAKGFTLFPYVHEYNWCFEFVNSYEGVKNETIKAE